MEHLKRHGTAFIVLGAILSCSVLAQDAHGRDWLWSGEPRTVLFSSVELGGSLYGSGGFKRALGKSLDTNGFVLMGTNGAGILHDRVVGATGLNRIDYRSYQASLVAGYQWFIGDTVITLYGGAETDYRQSSVNGTIASGERPRFGARFQADIWARPTENSLVTGTVIVGSALPHLWAHHSWGYQIWEGPYVGPEASLLLEEDYREARVGLHATGLTIGRYKFRLSSGIALTRYDKPGGYITLGTYFRP